MAPFPLIRHGPHRKRHVQQRPTLLSLSLLNVDRVYIAYRSWSHAGSAASGVIHEVSSEINVKLT
jgi:hypothetical protein